MISLKKIYNLLIEDEQQDLQFRRKAIDLFNKVINYLSKYKDMKEICGIIDKGNFEGSWVLKAENVDKEYKDLHILFTEPQKQYDGGFSIASHNGEYVRYITTGVLPKKYFSETKEIMEKLKIYKNIFIHEVIHYFDSKRWKGGDKEFYDMVKKMRKDLNVAFASGDKSKQYQHNYGNPLELNAYYQDAISKYIDAIDKARKEAPHRLSFYIPKNVNDFVKMIKQRFFYKEFLNNVSPEYLRKIDKRLVKLYDTVRDILPKIKK